MIFMSQSGLTDPAREPQWDDWYVDHLNLMMTVPGFHSAQRFKTASPGYSPSLAMYTVDSEDVFKGAYYLSVRGMGEWAPLIDRRYYMRNLFGGLDAAPAVAPGEVLLVVDRDQPDENLKDVTWLPSVAIDRSPPYRGIRVIREADTKDASALERVAVYRPFAVLSKQAVQASDTQT